MAQTEIMEKQVFASAEKPWMKMYEGKEIPSEKELECTLNQFLWKRNSDNMDKPAINWFDNIITFSQLKENIEKTAKALVNLGVKENDIITVVSVTTPEVIYLTYALDMIGAIPNMVDPRTSADGILEYMEEVGSKYAVVIDMAYIKVKYASEHVGAKKVIVVSPRDSLKGFKRAAYRFTKPDRNKYASNVQMWDDFIAGGKDTKAPLDNKYDPERGSIMLHTGGTTGTPKCVLLSAKNLNSVAFMAGFGGDLDPSKKWLDIMPPFIAYGFGYGVHMPLVWGEVAIIIPAFVPSKFASILLKYKPQQMAGVPLHYQVLARDPKVKNKDLSFIESTGCGGDSISIGAEREVNAFLKSHNIRYPLCKGYGMTEVSAIATFCVRDFNKEGSVGFPVVYDTIAAFEPDTDKELACGEEGEICITGPNVMIGYFGNAEETAKVIRRHSDGRFWVHSGDIGIVDEDGYIFIRSRIKRVVIRHDGFKVFSTTIENAVSKHPDVESCAAVGVKDKDHLQGKLPYLFITKKQGSTLTDNELKAQIKALCEKELPEYVQPAEYKVTDALPYTGIGKIDFRALELRAKELY